MTIMDRLWDVLGPLVALGLSVWFTFWYTGKLRKKNKKEADKNQFINEADEWAKRLINLCTRIKAHISINEWKAILIDRKDLLTDGERLSLTKTFGNELPDDIRQATEFLSKLPGDTKWNEDQMKELRELSDLVKDAISILRYEK